MVMAGGIGASAFLDQHRAQVWAYHLIVAGLIAASSDGSRRMQRLRWLTIGIYAWSALSKCDVSFVAGPGKLLWEGLLHAINIDAASLPAPFNRSTPWLMPAGELLTAIALAFPRWRRVGLWLSIVMHTAILLAVGPLGLCHEAGVQIWNGLFIIQNIILFRRAAAHEKSGGNRRRTQTAFDQNLKTVDLEFRNERGLIGNTSGRSLCRNCACKCRKNKCQQKKTADNQPFFINQFHKFTKIYRNSFKLLINRNLFHPKQSQIANRKSQLHIIFRVNPLRSD